RRHQRRGMARSGRAVLDAGDRRLAGLAAPLAADTWWVGTVFACATTVRVPQLDWRDAYVDRQRGGLPVPPDRSGARRQLARRCAERSGACPRGRHRRRGGGGLSLARAPRGCATYAPRL